MLVGDWLGIEPENVSLPTQLPGTTLAPLGELAASELALRSPGARTIAIEKVNYPDSIHSLQHPKALRSAPTPGRLRTLSP
jgi:hypothetical protein